MPLITRDLAHRRFSNGPARFLRSSWRVTAVDPSSRPRTPDLGSYIRNGRVVGISKLARGWTYSQRPQIQEKMMAQIANTINDVLKPGRWRDHQGDASLHDHARRTQARHGPSDQNVWLPRSGHTSKSPSHLSHS